MIQNQKVSYLILPIKGTRYHKISQFFFSFMLACFTSRRDFPG